MRAHARFPAPSGRRPVERVHAFARQGAWRGKVGKLGELLRADTRGEFYRLFVSYWSDPGRVVRAASSPSRVRARHAGIDLRVHDEAGHGHLPARRHPGQGGPRGHGGQSGNPRAADRSPRLRIRLEPAAPVQGARRHRQVAAAPGAAPPCPSSAGGPSQARFRRAAGRLVARTAARLGRGAAGSGAAAPGRLVRARTDSAQMARACVRPPQLGQPSVGRADDAGLARPLSRRRARA